MKVYYAHPVSLYNTEQEKRDLETLVKFGFEVVNPNSKEHSDNYAVQGMPYFERLAKTCDACAFRAFPGGEIGSGIATEVNVFIRTNRPVIELPNGIGRRSLTVDQTREYLRDIGVR